MGETRCTSHCTRAPKQRLIVSSVCLRLALLEALACQTPCVASAVGGIVDILQDGINGFLVEPENAQVLADKILQLINDDDLRLKMGMQGNLYVRENFSWQAKAREIDEIYQTVLGA